jgi:cell division protein FtsI/penicillin-binding protein 2
MELSNKASPGNNVGGANRRIQVWYIVLLVIAVIFIGRLFYLQIVKHEYYHQQALSDQLKEYTIAPQRGTISAHEASQTVPLVLNQQLYTLYVDPVFIKDAKGDSAKIAPITAGDEGKYQQLMLTKKTRYVVLAKRLSEAQKKKIEALKLPGIGLQALNYRTYPQGSLASQMLGFVDNDGKGQYGVEQYLNKQLSGTPGEMKAITDVRGVPLAASKDNIQINPIAGDNLVLTVDLAMQKQLETILKNGLDNVLSTSGSALIIDANTGAVKAMANWPTYDPSQYFNVKDGSVFNNANVSSPLEVGSIMKVLTTSAALDVEAIQPNTSYNDPGSWSLDGHQITNAENHNGPTSIAEVLNLSMNTGATWILMQMGHQTGSVTKLARDRWNNYMVNHFQLGKPTDIEQGYEASGYIPDPDKGYALELTYANTAFGQAMMATPLQMAAALASAVNGGTYYKPYLVESITDSSGKMSTKKPVVAKQQTVTSKTSQEIRSLMEYMITEHAKGGFSYLVFPSNYSVGGKTGTPEIADPAGGYYTDRFNGTYMGYVGGDKPQYVIFIRVNVPKNVKYGGSGAAQPIFASVAHMLIDNFNVTPKTGQ